MSAPVARYLIVVDRYLTDDCDGPGLYHDGTGRDAARQLADELQEAWDSGGVAGHFRVIGRDVFPDDKHLPHGYAAQEMFTVYEDDPDA